MSRKSAKVQPETLKKEDIVQAVVIVDSYKGGFHPITHVLPTALIPVVNNVLLDYSLECLSLSSVQEVILFCSSHAELIREHIKKSKWSNPSSTMTVTVLVSETCRSLGDVMRDLDGKAVIRSDFILVSGNLVANLNLLPILQKHKEVQKKDKGAVMTMVFKEAHPGHVTRCLEDETILAVDSFSHRVLAHHKLKFGSRKKLNIPLETYIDRRQVELRFNLHDTQVAICSPAVPPLFADNFDFQTRDDFVRGLLMNEEILASTIYWYMLREAHYAAHVTNWQMYQAVSHDIIHRWIHPFTPDTPFSWHGDPYKFLRQHVYRQKSAKLGKGSHLEENVVVAAETSIGDNSRIAHSVIGRNCKIGNNVTIYKSYVWDNVVIEDNCEIYYSVVAHRAKLGKGVKLNKGSIQKHIKGCVIGPDVLLPSSTALQASIIVSSAKHADGSGDQDEEYKLEKLAQNAYSLQVVDNKSDSEDEDETQHLHGFWLGTNHVDVESDSDDELISGSEKSDREPSPVLDDTQLFFTEVMDSLTRGYDDKLNPENLILEINSSRYAYNVSVREVNYFVVKAILSLPIQTRSANTTPKYLTEFNKLLKEFLPILQNYMRNSDAQQDCLQALEDMAATTDVLQEGLIKLLHLLYEKEVINEENILKWHSEGDEDSDVAAALRKQVAPFIQWLKEADEESDESDSE